MKNAWVIITGAAQRMGREIALSMAAEGWHVILHCNRSLGQAQQTAQAIQALGVQCRVLQADLSNSVELNNFFELASRCGPIRCLINNAAQFEFDEPAQVNVELFHQHMAVNLLAPLLLTQHLYSHVPEGEQAVVVHLLDQKLDNLNPDFFSYTLSKAGLAAALKMQAMALAPRLRVVAVSPGLTLISHLQTEQEFEKTHQLALLKSSSQPKDISRAVLFLVNSSAITGVNLTVDGGQHLLPLSKDFSKLSV